MTWLGDAVDNVGTFFNLPEFGISELITGGKTVNTGRVRSINGNKFVDSIYDQQNPADGGGVTDDNSINAIATGTGSGGGGGVSAADLAYLDDQAARLERQRGSANTALSNGLVNLQDSFNQEQSKANTDRSRALEDFQLKREDTTRQKNTALNRVDDNSRMLANGLRSRIGQASGANSSAYQFAAPSAVARDASRQRTGVQESYGINDRNLSLSENRAKDDFDELNRDLVMQKNQRESDFRAGILDRLNQIDNSRAEIARQRAMALGGGYNNVRSAMAPFSSAIDTRQAEIDSLFDKYRTPFNVKAVNVQAPDLKGYVTGNSTIAANSPTSAADPFADLLKKKLQEDNLNA